jgi:peptidase M23-like protein
MVTTAMPCYSLFRAHWWAHLGWFATDLTRPSSDDLWAGAITPDALPRRGPQLADREAPPDQRSGEGVVMSAQYSPGRPASVRDALCPIRLAYVSIHKSGRRSTGADFCRPLSTVESPPAHGRSNSDTLDFMHRPRARLVLWIWLLVISPSIVAPAAYSRASTEWMWPLDPRPTVLRPFDPPSEPWLAGHRGVDLSARFGQHVRSAGAGVVTFAGRIAGLPVVTVSHGALRTTYEPVEPAVQVGDRVRAGDPIGRLSRSGAHCGIRRPCLHWGLLRGSTYLDPLALLGSGPIRLLPHSAGTAPDPTAADVASRTRPHAFSGQERDSGPGRGHAVILGGSALVLGALGLAVRRRWLETARDGNGSGR